MADEGLTKAEINAIFKRLKSIPANRQCFDCGAMNPTWASVTYGVLVCIDCSAVHRSLGVHITFIRSTQLDTSWNWLQLRAMQVGGNAAAHAFFQQHGCTSTDAQQKYNSRAAQMYREKLHTLALKALKQHGKKVHIDSGHGEVHSPTIKESVDFFSKQENDLKLSASISEPVPIGNGDGRSRPVDHSDEIGPSVDAALSMSPSTAMQQMEGVKSTIGMRKPAAAKKGLGGKKGGLGATKVATNFTEIESAALQREKDTAAAAVLQPLPSAPTGNRNVASLNLAYNDLSLDEKKRAEKMKNMDAKKKQQMERLGMGAAGTREISHSAMSDMQSISQETPTVQSRNNLDRYSSRGSRDRDYEDGFDLIHKPPRYDNSFALKSDDSSSKLDHSDSWDIIDDNKQSGNIEDISFSSKDSSDERSRSRKVHEVSDSTEAQKKFGNAKAISSDQYFGGKDADFEVKQNLSKFEGSSSISSSELFGDGGGGGGGGGGSGQSKSSSHSYYYSAGNELADIKEGVRQSVTKVAGRLSSLASGVMSSIQNN